MTDTMDCFFVEERWSLFISILLIVLIVSIGCLALLVYIAIKVVNGHGSSGTWPPGDGWLKFLGSIKLKGPISALNVLIVFFVGVIWIGGAAASYKDYYAVHVDANAHANENLGTIKELLSHDTRSRLNVKLIGKAACFPVRGDFDGQCMADLYGRICGRYTGRLNCIEGYKDRSMTIELVGNAAVQPNCDPSAFQ